MRVQKAIIITLKYLIYKWSIYHLESPNERTNSIVFFGNDNQRSMMRSSLDALDVEKTVIDKNIIVTLRYANASAMADTLNKMATNKGIMCVADSSNNSLIITGTKAQQASIRQVIQALDRRKPQVLVEAIIADVSQDLTDKLGSALVSNGAAGGISSNFGGLSSVAGIYGAIQNKAVDTVPTGLVLAGRDGALDLVFNALRSDANTNIVSTPSLVTLDNEEAKIVVGQEVPFKTGSTAAGNGSVIESITRKDVGITFKITPQIDNARTVKLAVTEEVSNLAVTVATASDLITNKREITTNVLVNDGQIVVLGGLVEDQINASQDKTPVLGDIPLLGNLFKSSTGQTRKTNLMLFIHPVILPDPESADQYTRAKHAAIVRRVAPQMDTGPVQSGPGEPASPVITRESLDSGAWPAKRPQHDSRVDCLIDPSDC